MVGLTLFTFSIVGAIVYTMVAINKLCSNLYNEPCHFDSDY